MSDNSEALSPTYIEQSQFSEFNVTFPKTPDLDYDMGLVNAELIQTMEEHDRLVLHFKGRPSDLGNILAQGDPVLFEFSNDITTYEWNGYVANIDQINTPLINNTDITCVSASYYLKQTDQKIYKNVTADQVVKKVAAKHGMVATTQRHPRVRESIVQAGQSDWQLLRRLAKQTGFALRAENTTIIFMDKTKIYETKKPHAPYFFYVNSDDLGANTKGDRATGTILYFTPYLAENSPELGVQVDRVITGLNEKSGEILKTTHPLKDFTVAARGRVAPGEDYFL
jgi:hypothetical protein